MASGLYIEPRTVEEAVAALAEHGSGSIVAGGSDYVVGARAGRLSLPDVVVAVHRIAGLDGIEVNADGSGRIGALVTHATIESDPRIRERWPALADSSALVGALSTRNVGTIAGNIVNASPAMESGSPLLVYEASVELRSASGTRTVPYSEFVLGPRRTALQSGEIVTGIILPAQPAGTVGSAYLRLQYREAMEIAVVGAGALVALDASGAITAARIALTAVAPTCVRAGAAETLLVGKQPTAALLKEAGVASVAAAAPIDDVRAPADYRKATVGVIARRALENALARAGKEIA